MSSSALDVGLVQVTISYQVVANSSTRPTKSISQSTKSIAKKMRPITQKRAQHGPKGETDHVSEELRRCHEAGRNQLASWTRRSAVGRFVQRPYLWDKRLVKVGSGIPEVTKSDIRVLFHAADDKFARSGSRRPVRSATQFADSPISGFASSYRQWRPPTLETDPWDRFGRGASVKTVSGTCVFAGGASGIRVGMSPRLIGVKVKASEVEVRYHLRSSN